MLVYPLCLYTGYTTYHPAWCIEPSKLKGLFFKPLIWPHYTHYGSVWKGSALPPWHVFLQLRVTPNQFMALTSLKPCICVEEDLIPILGIQHWPCHAAPLPPCHLCGKWPRKGPSLMLKHRDRHPAFAIALDLVIKEGLKAIAVDLVGVPPEQRSLGFLCWGLIVQFNIHIYPKII